MSGKTVFRNIMGILLPGVDSIIADRTNQTYGLLLEKSILLSLEIIILVLEKDSSVSDFWRPLYQVIIQFFFFKKKSFIIIFLIVLLIVICNCWLLMCM